MTAQEQKLICEALMHLHESNGQYLTWKKDEYSQKIIPVKMKEIIELYHKVSKDDTYKIEDRLIEHFIKVNRKICWESEYENGEYCIGEESVIEFIKSLK